MMLEHVVNHETHVLAGGVEHTPSTMTGQHRENTTPVTQKPDTEPVITGKVIIDGQDSQGNVSFRFMFCV